MHILIVGKSGSGKSNLSRYICNNLPDDKNIIVYDPTMSPWIARAEKYSNADTFLDEIEKKKEAYVFIDEARTIFDCDTRAAEALIYRGRHRGLRIFILATRGMMIPPNARHQCSTLIAFNQSVDDSTILSKDFHADVIEACKLESGCFFISTAYEIQKKKLKYDGLNFVKSIEDFNNEKKKFDLVEKK